MNIKVNGKPSSAPFVHHALELYEESGLSKETVAEAGIYSEGDRNRLASILNWKNYPAKNGAAMVFPFVSESGDSTFQRIKPDHPPKVRGKEAKYLSPTGSDGRVYIPPSAYPAIRDLVAALFLTEGEKKALKATQEGFPCLGLTGVDCWRKKKGTTLHPDLSRIHWKGRRAFIVFDSDAADNENVEGNIRLLGAALKNVGAEVFAIYLPQPKETDLGRDGKPIDKFGLDDFLVHRGPAEFNKLIKNAEPPAEPDPKDTKQSASKIDFAPEAESFLQERGGRLRYYRGAWFVYRNGRYHETEEEEVRAEITHYLNRDFTHVSRSVVTNVFGQVKTLAIIPARKDPPCWLGRPEAATGWSLRDCLITRSQVVHLPSLATGAGIYAVPSGVDLFNTTCLEFDYDPAAESPSRWEEFLQSVWGDDPESIDALQQWFGYCLTPDTSHQKMLFMCGPTRSGKGVTNEVLRNLVGADNCSSPTLSSLSQPFGLAPLVGKRLATIPDARLSGRSDAVAVVERLLSITGEDPISVARKYLPDTNQRLETRVMMLTNELPRLNEASGALVARIVMLRMTKSFKGREDRTLAADLRAELPGILKWAIEGWKKLQIQGRFSQPESGEELLADFRELSSPISEFIDERCRFERIEYDTITEVESLYVPRAEIYRHYQEWCERKGRRHIEDNAGFGRLLRAAVPDLRDYQARIGDQGEDGKRKQVRCYRNIALKNVPVHTTKDENSDQHDSPASQANFDDF